MSEIIKRGDIYYADLGEGKGSEQKGYRPVLIIQNNIGNKYSPTVIVAAITSSNDKNNIPTHVPLDSCKYNLPKNSIVLLEQVRTIDKTRLNNKVGRLDNKIMDFIDRSLDISLGLGDARFNESYVYEKLDKIKKLDVLINKYKHKENTDITMQKLERISVMGDIINYCKNFNIDCRIYLEGFTTQEKIAV